MRILAKAACFLATAALCTAQTTPKCEIEGDVVEGASGRALVGARVGLTCCFDSTHFLEEPVFAITNDLGHFRFTGLECGSQQLAAQFPRYRNSDDSVGYGRSMRVNTSPAHPKAEVRLEMQRYAAIVGKVTDSSGFPVDSAQIEIFRRYPAGERHDLSGRRIVQGGFQYLGQRPVIPDDRGEFRFAPLAPGAYYLAVQPFANMIPPDRTLRLTFYPQALDIADAIPVVVAERQEVRVDLRLVRQSGIKVSGRLLGASASQITSIAVYQLSPATTAAPALFSATGERYELPDLLPGRYILYASVYDPTASGRPAILAATRRIIDVGSEPMDGLDLALLPTHDLPVEVTFESGCAAGAVIVEMLPQNGSPGLVPWRSDSGGRFVAPHVPPGTYKLAIRSEILPMWARSARLGDAEVLNTQFEITPETAGPLQITMTCHPGGR